MGGASLRPMARGATARLFVAVDPPAEVREELAEWAREAIADRAVWRPRRPRRPQRPPRLLKTEGLHLTLCFLGGEGLMDDLAGFGLGDQGEAGLAGR